MKKLLLFFALTIVSFFNLYSQNEKRYTILYLIPFDVNNYDSPYIKEPEDMEKVRSYGLMGFWNGSQMALDEYEKKNVHLDIIVRDVGESEVKLRNIMEDQSLMERVDLIIGPFFHKSFIVAANYAKEYKIPIVNPFTSHHNIIENNEFVFKLKPSQDVCPSMLTFIAQQHNSFPILVYGDTNSINREWRKCRQYFSERGVSYIASTNIGNLVSLLQPEKKQILITFEDNSARNLMISRSILYSKKNKNLLFIVPETWLKSRTYDIEYYSQLNLHFFSDYYVDFNNEKTKVFIFDYTQRFGTPPTTDNYAFQGYDVTRYFVEYLLNNNDIDRVKVNALSYPFTFDKNENEGFENVNLQFLEVIDNEVVPSGY